MAINDDQRRAMNAGLSRFATADAEHRRCPNCNRGGGLGRLLRDALDPMLHTRICRYCGFMVSTDPDLDGQFDERVTGGTK